MSSGCLIRQVKTEDRASIARLIEVAFSRNDEAMLVERLWDERAIHIERLAQMGGGPVGYCAFSALTCEPALDGLLLGLAPLAVAPAHQKQGVGAALVQDGLKLCRAKNARLIAVLGDPKYYARFGFEPAARRNLTWAGPDAGRLFGLSRTMTTILTASRRKACARFITTPLFKW